ncbi:enoyl-CoA hydratase [Intrasporangium oryzae NRRL B-24470]|uniref:Enoyl-CoA hydratase n=1 Tax=Intrasporangium oryzae NRRL B-24470 TaxID=1386089 RepID=W9GD16_9MICO|nr:enoyl-CoA hydratase-related protein [Intrasporangium oryzae]EWT02718.1 enoyl-CoA hydratase [Intrasporangium oryzae NRRL B-24470]
MTSTSRAVPGAPVVYGVHGGVATIELNRPESSNALDLPLAGALLAALDAAAADDGVRVVLLLGRGRLFCGGGDVAAMAAARDRGAFLRELADAAHQVVRRLDVLEKPVVAGVQGAAAGAGLALTLSADLVIAGESATFLTAYTAIGLTPDCGTSWLLPRAVGLGRALDLVLTGRRLSAAEAVELGIAARTCPDAEVPAVARAVAERLASGPAYALGQSRRLLRSAQSSTLDEHLDREAAAIAAAGATDEAAALVDAFVEGRR